MIYVLRKTRPFTPMLLAAMAWLVAMAAPASATELVLFERAGCSWCELWKSQVGPIYHKTVEGRAAPLRVVHLDRMRPPEPALKTSVLYTPTFVVIDEGREIGRIVGYSNDDMFWGQLGQILALKLNTPKPPAAAKSAI